MHNEHDEHPPAFWRSPGSAALLVIGAVAVYFLITEHRAHLAGVLPFALLALAMFPILLVMYARLAVNEEREMQRRFGAAYDTWAAATPRFSPLLRSQASPA